MNRVTLSAMLVSLAMAGALLAASNVDNTVPNKYSWGENVGWWNWRDANGGLQGVNVGNSIMEGYIWGENVGWINVGDGTPGSSCSGLPCYANVNGTDFGVNISADGSLHGYGWGENIGWINFDGGTMATPAQPAKILCAGRLTGYAWGENVGWINLSVLTPGQYVAVVSSFVPVLCDMNHDGVKNGLDIQAFENKLLLGGANWRDICSGDLAPPPGALTTADIPPFVACLLTP